VREFLATKQITVLEHPAYSPDLAPNDFFLFPKVKEILKGRHFDDIDDIKNNTTAALKAIPQNQFQNWFEGWTRRWHRCIASQGEYKGSTLKATTVVFSSEVCSTFTAMSSRTLLSDHVQRPGREPDNSHRLMPKLIICGCVPPLPQMPSWRTQGRLYLLGFTKFDHCRNREI